MNRIKSLRKYQFIKALIEKHNDKIITRESVRSHILRQTDSQKKSQRPIVRFNVLVLLGTFPRMFLRGTFLN
jgi:hypothetical protein